MNSIWGSTAMSEGANPFATQSQAPAPGGSRSAHWLSALPSSSKTPTPLPQAAGARLDSGMAAHEADAASSSQGSTATTITGNDFLTLLVTEMQNQDPTAQTDPNAYIDQLVQINSLEQLISINQNLETVLGAASGSSGTGSSGAGAASATAQAGRKALIPAQVGGSAPSGLGRAAPSPHRQSVVPVAGSAAQGNLSAGPVSPASQTVAHALDGRGKAGGHAIRDIPTRPLP